MAFCPHCGKEISDDATACSACEREVKPPAKSGDAKFKGTILMPSADALKQVQKSQPTQAQTDAKPNQLTEKGSEPRPAEPNPQGANGLEKPKRGFQATILGTGPVVAQAMSDANKEHTSSATVLQSSSARPPANEQGVSSPSTTSSPPLSQKGGTMIAGSISTPIAPESKPIEAPQPSAPTAQPENSQPSNVSGIGKTELAVPDLSIPLPEAQQPDPADGEVPILKQPEAFDFPQTSEKKNNLGMWMAIGCFGMIAVGAIVGGIAYFLLG